MYIPHITDLHENLIYARNHFGCRYNESIHSVLDKPIFNKEKRACKKVNDSKNEHHFLCRIPWEQQEENQIPHGTGQKVLKKDMTLGLDIRGGTGAGHVKKEINGKYMND